MSTFESTPNWLLKRKNLTPNRTAVVFEDESYTFQELYLRAKKVAGKLSSMGINRDTKTAILLKNHIDTVVIIHALQFLGSTAVMLNIRLQESEVAYQLKDSEATFLITQNDFQEISKELKKQLNIPFILKEDFYKLADSEVEIRTEFDLTEICTIMYTSGTTGFPKGVLQTYGNHWWSAIGSVLNLGLHEKDAWLAAVPLFHISGYSILVKSVVYGIPVILYEKFDEVSINQALIDGKATIISVVTTMLKRLVEELAERDYSSLFRCALLGGGPVPLSLLEKCKAKNIPAYQSYGLTETSSQIVTLSPEDSLRKLGSAGKPLFPSEVMIKKDGHEAMPNEIGEIAVKGPNVTKGYLNRPEANQENFSPDGWFFTGDVGYLDEEGYLYVIDRRSDLIISGGENIYPAEIENIILSHPAVKEAAVVGVQDPQWGQVPYAFYVVKNNQMINAEELAELCYQHLGKFKIPKKWKQIDEIPKNASNKVVRRLLKEQAEDDIL